MISMTMNTKEDKRDQEIAMKREDEGTKIDVEVAKEEDHYKMTTRELMREDGMLIGDHNHFLKKEKFHQIILMIKEAKVEEKTTLMLMIKV